MKYLSLIFLNLKAMKFREVNYFATVDEFHALFIYLYILYVFIYVYMYVYPLLRSLTCIINMNIKH